MEAYSKRKLELTVEEECLLWSQRVVIPGARQGRVLQELYAVHDGIVRIKSLARLHGWWPNIYNDIVRTVGSVLCVTNFEIKQFKSISTGRHPKNAGNDCT
ncbi:unnamed protein product [Ixodes persulcatus]